MVEELHRHGPNLAVEGSRALPAVFDGRPDPPPAPDRAGCRAPQPAGIRVRCLPGTRLLQSKQDSALRREPQREKRMLELIYFLDLVYKIITTLIFVRVVLSWFPALRHPAVKVVHDLTSPILDPIRRVIPAAGGLDLSPIVAILLLYLVRNLLVDLLVTLRP
ncbi:MAG: YggT family protein [Armatimonadetes bacterium]|nr:YggT family protein [Armatimonadota bacterium]